MRKTYLVFAVGKSSYDPATGKLISYAPGQGVSALIHDNLATAQAQADAHARGGYIAIIYESMELRQVKPVPVVVVRM